MDLYQKWASKNLTDSAVHNFVANLFPTTKKNNDDPEFITTNPYSLMGGNLIRRTEIVTGKQIGHKVMDSRISKILRCPLLIEVHLVRVLF